MNNIINTSIAKAFFSFLWLLPFLYMFSDAYFPINYKLPLVVFQVSIFVSLFSSFILVIMWFKEFREISYQTKVFKYLREENLLALDHILQKTSVEKYTENGVTLLQYAIDNQLYQNTIIYLLSKNSRVIYTTDDKYNLSYTLFYICAYYNYVNEKIILSLIKLGADVNFVDSTKGFKGLSVLNVLILRNNNENISLILEYGADINYYIKDISMNSLMLAAKYVNDPFIIKTLVNYGASVTDINRDGYNALLFASQYNSNPSIISVIINYGATIKSYNIRSAILKHNYVTPLMLAASYNNESVVRTLIRLGDNINYKDSFGLSVLFMAAVNNYNVEVVKTLINSGASLEDSRDIDGNTPLMAASYLNSNINVIRYLIERSHNLKTKNKDGLDFIDYLKQNKNISEDEVNIIINKWI